MSLQEAQNTWNLLCQYLAHKMQERVFRDWISPCVPIGFTGDTLKIQTPDRSTKLWIEQQMADELYDALVHVDLPDIKLVFTIGEEKQKKNEIPAKPAKATISDGTNSLPSEASVLPQGFESYTLDNFVVGPSCNMAFNAAQGIVENYGRSNLSNMNPLFIYGGSGLGKTHLMIGIGKGLIARHPKLQLAYLKAETFVHELTGAIRANNTEPLRQKYQSKNVLLFDDIQTLHQNMVRTQEEIFYILEYMINHGKHIVITCDRPPDRLEGLHDRLLTRCKAGLTVDVYAPDFETRVAILKKKLEDPAFEGYPSVPDDVLYFIANKAKASVRDLQGLLKRTLFQASFAGVEVSLDVAQEAYRGTTGNEPLAAISMEKICRTVAEQYKISFSDLTKKKSRLKEYLIPRQLSMYLCRELTTASYEEIGRVFNNMHHSTVMNAIESTTTRMQKDSHFHKLVRSLLNSIG